MRLCVCLAACHAEEMAEAHKEKRLGGDDDAVRAALLGRREYAF